MQAFHHHKQAWQSCLLSEEGWNSISETPHLMAIPEKLVGDLGAAYVQRINIQRQIGLSGSRKGVISEDTTFTDTL